MGRSAPSPKIRRLSGESEIIADIERGHTIGYRAWRGNLRFESGGDEAADGRCGGD